MINQTKHLVATLCAALALAGCPRPCGDTIPALAESIIDPGRGAGAWDFLATADGGFVVAGFANSAPSGNGAGSADTYLAKIDGDFNVQWSRTYGGSEDEHILSVEPAGDGGYLMAGLTGSEVIAGRVIPGNSAILIAKADAEGNEVWRRVIRENVGANAAHALCVNTDGSFVIAGGASTNIFTNEYDYAFLFKFSASGEQLWRRQYSRHALVATAAVATTDGGYALAGYARDASVGVLGVDRNGDLLWEFVSRDSEEHNGLFLAQDLLHTRDGGFAVLGVNSNTMTILKLDGSGMPQWATRVPFERFTRGYAFAEAADGSLIAVGESSPNAPPIDIRDCARNFAVRLSEDGDVLWKGALGGNFSSAAMAVAMSPSGYPVLAGYTLSDENYNPRAIYLLATDAGGPGGQSSTQ